MTPWRRSASAGALAVLLGQAGCSLVFLKAPPEDRGDPRITSDCSTSAVPQVLDALCSVVGFTYLATAIVIYPELGQGGGDSSAAIIAMGVAGAALGSACAYSAAEGGRRVARCREVKALERRCAEGDAPACWGQTAPR